MYIAHLILYGGSEDARPIHRRGGAGVGGHLSGGDVARAEAYVGAEEAGLELCRREIGELGDSVDGGAAGLKLGLVALVSDLQIGNEMACGQMRTESIMTQ